MQTEIYKSDLHIGKANKTELRKRIIAIAWPSVTELLLIQMCDMVNLMMVGKLGANALAAVAITMQPKFFLLSIFMAFNVGTTALIARLKGENNTSVANNVVKQSLFLTILLAIAVTALGMAFPKQLIVLMGGQGDIIEVGSTYFRIIMIGFIFTTISMNISAALRGAGNTRAAMNFSITSNLMNVALNYVLIYGKFMFPAMGVNGAAVSTVIGAFTSALMAILVLVRGNSFISLSFKERFRTDTDLIRRMVKVGLPAAGEQLALRGGLLLYIRVVAGLGTTAFATHQIALSILNLSFMSGQAFGIAATSLVGQSLGQEHAEMANDYAAETRRMGSLVSTLIAVSFFIFGPQMMALYTNDIEIIKNGALVLKITALMQPFQSSFLILSGALRGAGDARWPAIATFIGILGLRPLLSFICVFILPWGLVGAWIALFIDQLFRSIFIFFRFRSGKWMNITV